MIAGYRRLTSGALTGNRTAMAAAARTLGYFDKQTQEKHQTAVLDIFEQAFEPLRCDGRYDFGESDLPKRIHETGLALGLDRDFWHVPPADALFLHRKLGGLYLLAARLKARVNVHELVHGFID